MSSWCVSPLFPLSDFHANHQNPACVPAGRPETGDGEVLEVAAPLLRYRSCLFNPDAGFMAFILESMPSSGCQTETPED